jgi:hypothetical protein
MKAKTALKWTIGVVALVILCSSAALIRIAPELTE